MPRTFAPLQAPVDVRRVRTVHHTGTVDMWTFHPVWSDDDPNPVTRLVWHDRWVRDRAVVDGERYHLAWGELLVHHEEVTEADAE